MNYKKLLLIIIALSVTVGVFSQEKKNQINFSIGPSFAVGDFGDNSSSNDNAGFAGTGANLYLFYTHRFTKNVGLGVKWFGNSNEYDTDPTIEVLNNSTGELWTTSTSYWSTGGFMLGIIFHMPASEKFIVDFRFLVGYLWSTSPESEFFVKNQPDVWVKLESASDGVDGYDMGAGLTWLITPKLGLNLYLDYMIATFKYDMVVVSAYDGTHDHSHNVKQPFDIINSTIGISFYF